MADVVLENLEKVYRDRGTEVRAVDRINLSVKDGEFLVLVGPSGCGKSTTLRLIAGLEEISSGTVSIGGRRVNEVPPKDRDIAMVFQNYALYPHLTVRENLAFGLRLRKLPREEIDRRVKEAAAMLGLDALLDRRPKALSGGQRQRVAVGRAVVRQPSVFLFDEPLSNLDARLRAGTRAELIRLHARLGATMVYVTHDQVEAMTMGDRICVMQDGRIVQVDEPIALYERPRHVFVAGFLGSPPMNFFRGTLTEGEGGPVFREAGSMNGIELRPDGEAARKAAAGGGREVLLGIRPEHIRLCGEGEAGASSVDVELSEPMGAETHVHLGTGATKFIVRAGPADRPAAGQKAHVVFDAARMHLFDPASGEAL